MATFKIPKRAFCFWSSLQGLPGIKTGWRSAVIDPEKLTLESLGGLTSSLYHWYYAIEVFSASRTCYHFSRFECRGLCFKMSKCLCVEVAPDGKITWRLHRPYKYLHPPNVPLPY